MVRRFAPRFTVWLALSAALACGQRGVPGTARDELVVATPGDPDSSGVVSGLGLHPVNANVYETLVRLTPDFRVAPQLATRWQLRLPNTWRFHLRQGVRMHDGTTLTAAAVVWTMRRIARAGGGPMGIGQSSARVIDDTTLDSTPTRPGRRLIEQLANPDWSIMAPGSDSAARPVGTGPFRLVEYARGDHLTVERFDQYWGDRARLRRLTFRFLADANARLLALRAGDVQVASDLPREAARAARMLPDIAVATSPVGGYEALYVTEPRPAIRRAIVYALDRPRLVEAAWRGTAEPAQLLGPAELLGRRAALVAGARSAPRGTTRNAPPRGRCACGWTGNAWWAAWGGRIACGGCAATCRASCRTGRARASAGIECRSRRIAFLGKISHGRDDNAAAIGGAPHRAPRHREDRRDPAPGTAQAGPVA